MARELLLGVDVGTSATKAVLCDVGGRVVATGSAEHPISQPKPGWSEQRPEDWWDSTVRATREAMGKAASGGACQVVGVGLSGQMHGLVLLGDDAKGAAAERAASLRPALLWNDQRTAKQCVAIEAAAGGRARLVDMVGNAALTGFTLPKLLWVKETEPAVYARVRAVLLPKDFVRLRMTGQLATDVGDAAGTLLFDVDRRAWSTKGDQCVRCGCGGAAAGSGVWRAGGSFDGARGDGVGA
jgi:xylulokinase